MYIFGEDSEVSAVSLVRYSQIIGYSECAFFGISHPMNTEFACRELWTLPQRNDIASYLLEAQNDIEGELGYPIGEKWFANEKHILKSIILSKWGHVNSAGIKAETSISNDAVVDLTDPDYGVVTVNPFVETYDLSEVHIFYPDTDDEIIPSNIERTGSFGTILTITIPRCRLVKYTLLNTPDEGLIYSDDSNFQTTVDVKRIYTDATTSAELVYRNTSVDFTAELTDATGMYIENPEIGKIRIELDVRTCNTNYTHCKINYSAGSRITREQESMIVRLAHSKMATEPCGCDVTQRLWARDRNIPKILTADRINCPFGMSDGAWSAWRWTLNNKLVRMSNLIGMYNG